jgi:glycine hydroxymethyltransferase
VTMLGWKVAGRGYAAAMVETAVQLAEELTAAGLPVFSGAYGPTRSHQFALRAQRWGGGQRAAKRLRRANLLASGIGLPDTAVDGDVNGLRMGTPELVRLGMRTTDMADLADLIARGLDLDTDSHQVALDVSGWRKQFSGVHFTADQPS